MVRPMIMHVEDSNVRVTRWRRYGNDRLYVEFADGQRVGWWDLTSDEPHAESSDFLGALSGAVAAWKAGEAAHGPDGVVDTDSNLLVETSAAAIEMTSVPTAAASRGPEPDMAAPARPWIDLSQNQPGAEAREQAVAAWEAAPVKTVLARVLGVHTDERAWRIGADGEEKVAAQLAKLAKKDPRWRFLHAIPIGTRGSDIDHLVIGPGGVFTVNAKHHPRAKIWVGGNTFMVNGNRVPYVRNSRHEATRAAKMLTAAMGSPVHVEGLIVAVNAKDVVVKDQPAGVSVVPRMQVAKWLLRHGDINAPQVVEAIFDAARRSTTWQSS